MITSEIAFPNYRISVTNCFHGTAIGKNITCFEYSNITVCNAVIDTLEIPTGDGYGLNKASEDALTQLRTNQKEWKYRDGHQRG